MAITIRQTDSDVVCTSSIDPAASRKLGVVGGTAGSTPVSFTILSSAIGYLIFEWLPGSGVTGSSGTWVLPINITTANMNLNVSGTFFVSRYNSSCVSQETLSTGTGGVDQSLGTTGVKTLTVTGMGAPSSLSATDKIMVYAQINNTAMSNQAFSFTPNQNIDSPFTAAAVFIAAPPVLITRQSRNRASLH